MSYNNWYEQQKAYSEYSGRSPSSAQEERNRAEMYKRLYEIEAERRKTDLAWHNSIKNELYHDRSRLEKQLALAAKTFRQLLDYLGDEDMGTDQKTEYVAQFTDKLSGILEAANV